MPKKGLNRNLDYVKSGLTDFAMDDWRITSHAKMRLRERGGTLEDLRRRPVLKGNTVMTYLPTNERPLFVSGELWSSTRTGDIAVKSPLLFNDACVVDVAGCVRQVRRVCSLIREKFNVNIYVTPKGQKALISGKGDTAGAVQSVKEIVKRTLDNAARLAAARLEKSMKKKRTTATTEVAATTATEVVA